MYFIILIGQCHTCPLQEKGPFKLHNSKCFILYNVLKEKFKDPQHPLADSTSYSMLLEVKETSREKVLGIISLTKLEHPDLLPIKTKVREVKKIRRCWKENV